jgi:hypothetical protein
MRIREPGSVSDPIVAILSIHQTVISLLQAIYNARHTMRQFAWNEIPVVDAKQGNQ